MQKDYVSVKVLLVQIQKLQNENMLRFHYDIIASKLSRLSSLAWDDKVGFIDVNTQALPTVPDKLEYTYDVVLRPCTHSGQWVHIGVSDL
jgi:hypothetical protein